MDRDTGHNPPTPKVDVSHRLTVVGRVVSFGLGTALIIDYIVSGHPPQAEIIAGLLLVGVLPIDAILDYLKK